MDLSILGQREHRGEDSLGPETAGTNQDGAQRGAAGGTGVSIGVPWVTLETTAAPQETKGRGIS